MTWKFPSPRLLPVTIFAIAVLLGVKTVSFVRAATPTHGAAIAAAAEPHHGVLGTAFAAATEKPPPAGEHAAAASSAAPPAIAPPAVAPPGGEGAAPPPPISDSERALLLDLRQRRSELETRETALASREAMLSAAEHKLQDRVAELESLQQKLEQLDGARKQREDANWRGLVKTYEDMKPRDAAAIFNDLDMQVLLQVVDRMKESKTAPVLAAMKPEKARQVTSGLAEMRAKANAMTTDPAPAPPGVGASAAK